MGRPEGQLHRMVESISTFLAGRYGALCACRLYTRWCIRVQALGIIMHDPDGSVHGASVAVVAAEGAKEEDIKI